MTKFTRRSQSFFYPKRRSKSFDLTSSGQTDVVTLLGFAKYLSFDDRKIMYKVENLFFLEISV